MKVAEAVHQMSKLYLQRVIDSFTRDFPKLDEDRSRETISKNVEELSDVERISRRLSGTELSYSDRILTSGILELLLNSPDFSASEEAIVEAGVAAQQRIIAEAGSPDSLQYENAREVDVLRTILEVAVEDDRITEDELRLIRRLREKLGITRKSQYVLLAQLHHYPRSSNRVHTPSEFREALTELQKCGVVFYCNRLSDPVFLIPEEMVPGVKTAIGLELSEDSFRLLLEALTGKQLGTILLAAGLPKSGRKEEQADRLVGAGIVPSEALNTLSTSDLYDLLSSLPGANVSGSKATRIDRVIDYFSNLVVKKVSPEADPAESYYQYFVELAHRDRENLLTNKVIKKDRNMDAAFEEGARYLFDRKLGLEHVGVRGSDHADGVLEFPSGDILMWDTKSKESVYTFPASHIQQFKRYIRDSPVRVSCFLVIAPEIADSAEEGAARLKVASKQDTDIAIISAEDLKWIAEEWVKGPPGRSFNLEVFNMTGILDRSTIIRRLRLFG